MPPRCVSGFVYAGFAFRVWGLALCHRGGELSGTGAAVHNLRAAPFPVPVPSTGRPQRGECCAVRCCAVRRCALLCYAVMW